MRRWPSSRTAVVGIAIAVFVVCCVMPVGYLLVVSLSGIDASSGLVLDARQRRLLFNTALLGLGTALLATAIGAPLGFALARISLRRKALLRLALAAPALLPPYIVGLAWTYLGSSTGWLSVLSGRELLSAWTYSLPAAILVLSLVLYPVSMLCLVVALIAAALLGDRLVVTRWSAGTGPVRFDQWRQSATVAAIVILFVALVLPLAILLGEALSARSLVAVLADSRAAMVNSLLLATIGATAVVSVAVWLAYARARSSGWLAQGVDILFVVLFAVPSTIVGVGLIGLWNRSGPFGAVYGTDAMLVLGYLARFIPITALALAATTRYVPVSHEEAAAVGGAGWLRTMWRIVLPQMRLGLSAAWVIAFVLAFGELGVSILVAPPGEATLPIRVYKIIANTPSSHVASLALFQTAVIFVPLAALGAAVSLREAR